MYSGSDCRIDDKIDELFYHPIPVAIALIVVGIVFIVVENAKKGSRPAIRSIGEITYKAAIIIGLFQLIAAVFPEPNGCINANKKIRNSNNKNKGFKTLPIKVVILPS